MEDYMKYAKMDRRMATYQQDELEILQWCGENITKLKKKKEFVRMHDV